MDRQTILICDDNIAICESLTKYLEQDGFLVRAAENGERALQIFRSERIDLIILDIMLPGMSGMEVCREIRKSSEAPVIFLSARGEERDRVAGLTIGGDDYVVKPFSPREVAARVRAILKRTVPKKESRVLRVAELTVDKNSYEIRVNDIKAPNMTPKEVELLYYLAENQGQVLSRDQILNAVWGYDYYGDTRTVDNQIKRIRRKLPMEQVHFAIRSVYGIGYKLEVV